MVTTLWTIGHSNRPLEAFLTLLSAHGIELVVDVRQFPGSRKYPHFGRSSLAAALRRAGIDYLHMPELGGRRPPRPDSPNTVWEDPGFRGYADYMETPAFEVGLERLLEHARRSRTAIMCSEALWWRCHRSMIADALKARGVRVLHIMGEERVEEHPYTTAASIVDGRLVYGAGPPRGARPSHDGGS